MAKWTAWTYIGFALGIVGILLIDTGDYTSNPQTTLEFLGIFLLALGILIVIHKLFYSFNLEEFRGKFVFSWKPFLVLIIGWVFILLHILIGGSGQPAIAGIMSLIGVIMITMGGVMLLTKCHLPWRPLFSMFILSFIIAFGGGILGLIVFDSVFGFVFILLGIMMGIFYKIISWGEIASFMNLRKR